MAWSSASSLRAAPRQWQGHDISYDERASRDATAAPGRPERRGVWGPFRGPQFQLGGSVAATKIKVIELAKELGVTSKDLMVAAEEMGHKGVRAMSPIDSTLANALRVKLGKGRDLPEEPKPKRVPRGKGPSEAGDAAVGVDELVAKKPSSRARKVKTEEEAPAEIKPAATIVKPKPAGPVPEVAPEPPFVPVPEPEIVPEPTVVAPPPEPPPVVKPAPIVAPPLPGAPKKPEPKIVPFRPIERPAPVATPRPSRQPTGPFAPPRVTVGPPRPAAPA